MTPLHFEQLYGADWQELEQALAALAKPRDDHPLAGERIAELYRRACGHLALARARSYPAYLVERLERMTAEAHQQIYRRGELGVARLWQLLARDIPRAVRSHRRYVWAAAIVMALPTLVLGVLVYRDPELVLSMLEPTSVAEFEEMYATDNPDIGRIRTASTDLSMFGFYIGHNTGLAFQCFAGGLLAGLGSLFYLAFNGAYFGAVAGYVTERGLSATFYSFIATHSAFELTAFVLSGAAGLRIGHALLVPGRYTRLQSLVGAARSAVVIVYGAALMLLLAAGIEAFWSSAGAVPHWLKYTVAAICWVAVPSYLTLQGRE